MELNEYQKAQMKVKLAQMIRDEASSFSPHADMQSIYELASRVVEDIATELQGNGDKYFPVRRG
jgi:hypothetical protein